MSNCNVETCPAKNASGGGLCPVHEARVENFGETFPEVPILAFKDASILPLHGIDLPDLAEILSDVPEEEKAREIKWLIYDCKKRSKK